MKFLDNIKKKSAGPKEPDKKNWYSDRYQSVIVQRNFLALITFVSLLGVMISVFSVVHIANRVSIEPFVIEVEEKTGITNVIRPLVKEKYAYDEVLRRYFLYTYIKAREEYSFGTYKYNYHTVVRLLSSGEVYNSFLREISPNNPNSPLKLGDNAEITIKVTSVNFRELPYTNTGAKADGFAVDVRFTKYTRTGSTPKIASIRFDYKDLSLNEEDRSVNPLGFQILTYTVDNEIL